jgi:cob(I)alamin adenosyltransferase
MIEDLKSDLKDIQVALGDIRITLAGNTKDLEEHMRRTELLEGHVSKLNQELVKLKTFYMVLGWCLGALTTAVTLGSQIWKVFH